MQLPTNFLPAKQHHAQECCLQEKSGQHFIGQHGAHDAAGDLREQAPIRTKLVAHHDPGYDAHGESKREDFHPMQIKSLEDFPAGLQPQAFAYREKSRETDREGRKENVKGDDESKLKSRQDKCIKFHEARSGSYMQFF